jgi:hypothetical protein
LIGVKLIPTCSITYTWVLIYRCTGGKWEKMPIPMGTHDFSHLAVIGKTLYAKPWGANYVQQFNIEDWSIGVGFIVQGDYISYGMMAINGVLYLQHILTDDVQQWQKAKGTRDVLVTFSSTHHLFDTGTGVF